MKRILALTLTVSLIVLALASCSFDPAKKSKGVMTYDEYVAAALESEVTIEAFVQAKQSWGIDKKDGVSKATFYLQDTEGGYFVYGLPCTEEEYNNMNVGTRLQIKGYKAEWSGEVEIIDATFKILNGYYVATPVDVTAILGTDELINYQNRAVEFKGMEIVASKDGAAFLYGWDGSGTEGGDIYFNASVNGKTYTFVIEASLTDATTDVYKAAQALKVGDVVDLGGFLYWYDDAQPHIVSIEK